MTATGSAAPMSDEAIRKGSGKTWAEWREVLDEWGAPEKSHAEIARYLVDELGVEGWWAQSVTVGYEKITGRRTVGERGDGTFSTSASKTVSAGIGAHFAAWVDEAQRNQWLAPGTLSLRTSQDGKSARFDDHDFGGIVSLHFADKGEDKSSVSMQIEKLPSREAIEERKATLKARLTDLAAFLKG